MRQLYPEYAAIDRRCKATSGRRYRNGSELMQALRRRARLGRRFILSAISVLAAAVIAVLWVYNATLRSSVDVLDGQLALLRNENQQERDAGLQQRKSMADSLSTLKNQLETQVALRNELERHDIYIANLKQQFKQQCRTVGTQCLKEKKTGKKRTRMDLTV